MKRNTTQKIQTKGTSKALYIYLFIMLGMILLGIGFPEQITGLLSHPALYRPARLVHIIAATTFFANALAGMLWEMRSMRRDSFETLLFTYDTVAWIDASFSSPLIIASVASGIVLSVIHGAFWQTPWLALSFALFIVSGLVWLIFDIPAQHRVRAQIAEVKNQAADVPPELAALLRRRLWISTAGVLPLFMVFILMILKPVISWWPL